MAKTATDTVRCPRCGAPNPPATVQCVSCGFLYPRTDAAPTKLKRVAGTLGRGVAFLLVVGIFAGGVWFLRGDSLDSIRSFLNPPPAEPENPEAVVAAAELIPATVVLTFGEEAVRITAGESAKVPLGDRGHALRVKVAVGGDRVELQPSGGPAISAADGETVTLHCTSTVLEKITRNGVMSMRQRPCEEAITVRVTVE